MSNQKENFIQCVGSLVYNALNDATKGKHKGAVKIRIPISASAIFQDANPWISAIEVDIPVFAYYDYDSDPPKWEHVTLDQYMEWIGGKNE